MDSKPDDALAPSDPTSGEAKSTRLRKALLVKDGDLMVEGKVKILTDDAKDGAQFDFKYDTEGKKLGAGTAFLKAAGASGP